MTTDMKNVNNWHWTEKNCLPWAKTYFDEKLNAIAVKDGYGTVKVNRVISLEGDCDLNQRKGKILPVFDLKLTLEWTGAPSSGDSSVLGNLCVPEICHDSSSGDYVFDFNLTGNDRSKSASKLLALARLKLKDEVKSIVMGFDRALIERHSKDVQIETVKEKIPAPAPSVSEKLPVNKAPVAQKFNDSLELEYNLFCSAHEIYKILTDAKLIIVWSKCHATFVAAPGLPFKLFSSTIRGTVDNISKDKQLVLKWRSEGWPEGHHSTVTINLSQLPASKKDNNKPKVRLSIIHNNIPEGWKEITERHWRDEVVEPIISLFSFGAPSDHLFVRFYKSASTHPITATAGLGIAASVFTYFYYTSKN